MVWHPGFYGVRNKFRMGQMLGLIMVIAGTAGWTCRVCGQMLFIVYYDFILCC